MEGMVAQVLSAEEVLDEQQGRSLVREAVLVRRVRELDELWAKLRETLQGMASLDGLQEQLLLWERAEKEAKSLYLRVGEIGNVLRFAATVEGVPWDEE